MIVDGVAQVDKFGAKRQQLIERFRAKPEMPDFCERHTALIDWAIKTVWLSIHAKYPSAPPIAVVATGGYGRRELAPYSDIDLTVVPLHEADPNLDAVIRELFRAMHHMIVGTLGLELGYNYRLVNDAPGLDEKSRTALLDARLVAGSAAPLDALMDLYWQTFPTGEFLISKLEERSNNFAKYHDTPLVVEPNLKDGAGGLRCFQAANWLRIAIGDRPMRRSKAYHSILRLRNLLQLVSCRRQDTFTRQRQAEIADLVQRDIYSLMSECAENGLALHQQYLVARNRIHETRFSLGGGVNAVKGQARVQPSASASSAAVGIAKATQLGLRIPEEETMTTGQIDAFEALVALASGEAALRNLDRSGLLKALLPELVSCRTLMPQDTAHTFTVFEHTFRAIRNLEQLQPGSFLGELKNSQRDLAPLYLAVLLHDVGKAFPEKPHSESGAEVCEAIAARWHLADNIARLVTWLVREHLSMARFIRMRDVYHPQSVQEFAALVADQERLDMLTLLTYCDIRAVSDDAWTPALESFLVELYYRTSQVFEGESIVDADPSVYRKRLLREMRGRELPEAEVQRFLDSMPAQYLASTPPDLVSLHFGYEKKALEGSPVIDFHDDPAVRLTELTVCCLDQPGLLSKILGVIYAYDLSIHAMRASTTGTEPPVALDVFDISFGGRTLPSATADLLSRSLKTVLAGERTSEEVLRARGKDPDRVQHNFSYSFLEGSPSILEVQAPRGRGMAYRLSRFIANQGWNITAARVGQWAGRGAAAFYILDSDHQPIPRGEVERAFTARV